jgi:glycerate-2-kinase
MKKAEELGFKPVILTDELFGIEASQAGKCLAAICKTIERTGHPFELPCVLLTTGEIVVTVGKEKGIGGPNQEFVLSAAKEIAGSKNIVIGSVDTDVTDGPGIQFAEELVNMPTCLAGGVIDGETVEEARKAGIDVTGELNRHNTSPALWALKSGVVATPSISLVDLTVALVMG